MRAPDSPASQAWDWFVRQGYLWDWLTTGVVVLINNYVPLSAIEPVSWAHCMQVDRSLGRK